jgi:hypothetical protein
VSQEDFESNFVNSFSHKYSLSEKSLLLSYEKGARMMKKYSNQKSKELISALLQKGGT